MHRHFDEQIKQLLERLVYMGGLAEQMIELAAKVLVERNLVYREEIKQKEKEVNALQIEVDERAVTLTALQQPVASDVRFLFMASRINTELERIGDQAVNISKNARHVIKAPEVKPLVDLPKMAAGARKMVRDALTALKNKDCGLAEQVLLDEEQVDMYRKQIFRDLLAVITSEPAKSEGALSLILISRNLEKIGDHASNIAEEIIYMVKGTDIRHQKDVKRDTEGHLAPAGDEPPNLPSKS